MSAPLPRAWQAVDLDAAHQGEVRALFAQVFGQPMAAGLWHWKYGDGRGVATGTRECASGRLLAHYGGTRRAFVCAGQALAAVQVGDVMVQAGARGVLSRSGPFAVATRRLLDLHIGQGLAFDFGFGFPNARAGRLGELLGLYRPACEVLAVHWPAPHGAPLARARRGGRLSALDWGDAASARRLDALWQRLARSSEAAQCVLGRRDAAWWRHRYANHPDAPYRCLWVRARWTRRLLGAVALRPGPDAHAPWELLDWLCAPGDTGAVLPAALAHCAAQGAAGLQAWLSAPLWTQVRAAAPGLAGGAAQPACTAVVSTPRSARADALLAGRAWWLTGGDTDFR